MLLVAISCQTELALKTVLLVAVFCHTGHPYLARPGGRLLLNKHTGLPCHSGRRQEVQRLADNPAGTRTAHSISITINKLLPSLIYIESDKHRWATIYASEQACTGCRISSTIDPALCNLQRLSQRCHPPAAHQCFGSGTQAAGCK